MALRSLSLIAKTDLSTLHDLAQQLEENAEVRDVARRFKSCLAWPDPSLVGVPSMKTLGANRALLRCIIEVWCSQHDSPKALVIKQLKVVIAEWRALMGLPVCRVKIHCEAWGAKRLFSYMIRRLTGVGKRRESLVCLVCCIL